MESEVTTAVSGIVQSEIIIFFIATIIILSLKDIASNFVSGIMFKLGPDFNEGDVVELDEKEAVIIDIGVRRTKFQQRKDDGTLMWRYVHNSRIPHLNISKVILDKH